MGTPRPGDVRGRRPAIDPDHIDRLAGIVAARHGIDADAILEGGQQAVLVQARRVIALVLRYEGHSYPQIGKALNRDHTTIMALVANASTELDAEAVAVLERVRTDEVVGAVSAIDGLVDAIASAVVEKLAASS